MSKYVHFMGISGSGASAVAAIAQSAGWEVTGCSDSDPHNEFTKPFKDSQLLFGHSASHLRGDKLDILAITPAILSWDPKNPELKAAKQKGIEVLTWQQFLGKYLTKDKFIIAVCGTHGKSTTTAMVGKMLEDAGLDPTVELGAIVPEWGTNYRVGKSKFLVVEADEYNNNFLSVRPYVSIVTSIEMDHPEFFKNLEDYKQSFHKFLLSTKQTIIANMSDPVVNKLLRSRLGGVSLNIIDYSKLIIDFPLKILGEFNKQNASAVFQLGLILDIDSSVIKKSLMNFSGISKRFEKLGEINGAQIYTDFAHHPTEIEVTVKAIRKKFPKKKIIIVFQPHMFSRTLGLFDDFVRVFKNLPADKTIIVDIYHAREEDKGLVNSQKLVRAINSKQSFSVNKKIIYQSDWEELEEHLRKRVGKNDVVVFMGAGVVDQIGGNLTRTKSVLKHKNGTPYKNKKVLILGLGLNDGGVGTTKFFAKEGSLVRITDLKSSKELKYSLNQLKRFKNISYTLGKHKYSDIDWADLIIRNPAIKPNNPYLKYALQKGKKVEMDFGIFTQFVQLSQIIGITGTKGKSTTASLIYEILKKAGRDVVFAGNIGKSMLDSIPYIKKNTFVVLELSSFHLQASGAGKFSPKFAVITNIFPDHLNYHQDMKEYTQMKKSVAKYQNSDGKVFVKRGDSITDTKKFKKNLAGEIIHFSSKDLPGNLHSKLIGQYNLDNIAAAWAVAKEFAINPAIVRKVVQEFPGIEFRMQKIYDKNGIKIYNDTTATLPNPTIEALKALPGCILIAGGMNKGLDYHELVKAIEKYTRAIYFLAGDATDEIKSKIKSQKSKVRGVYRDLEKLLKDLKQNIQPKDIVLFSPGATSFNLFQNEFDRGRKFNEAVKKVFR